MRLTIACVLCFCTTAVLGRGLDLQWMQYKREHGKVYSEDGEEQLRRKVFAENLRHVEKHNWKASAGQRPFTLALNKFADMTSEEYKAFLLPTASSRLNHTGRVVKDKIPGDIPDNLDWRKTGFVGPVRDQGQTGNPVVLATIDSVQFGERSHLKSLVPLSTQQLLECCGDCSNSCQKVGDCVYCLSLLGGVDSEASYPSRECKSCSFDEKDATVHVDGYLRASKGDEVDLKAAVATFGLAVVTVDASNKSFQLYSGGIYDNPDCSPDMLNHAMVIVGYGTEDGKDYWIVRNSWGINWGEAGCIRMSRNKQNQCGIATDAWIPLVTSV